MNEELSRRQFLRHLTVIGAAGLLLPLTDVDAAPTKFVAAGQVVDFPVGVSRAVTLPSGAVIQLRRLPGRTPQFLALSAHCTHKGCLVSWEPKDRQFHCPCHGGQFDASGKNIAGPPPTPLPVLKTKVVKGIVLVSP